MKWMLKAATQGMIARLPNPTKVNRIFQKYVTGTLGLEGDIFASKCSKLSDHLDHWRLYGGASEIPETALELGTGWYPIVPVGLRLMGCKSVYTIDQTSHLTVASVLETLHHFIERIDQGTLEPTDMTLVAKIRSLIEKTGEHSVAQILAHLGIEVIVGDARSVPLESGAIDLFVSNNTLEHIPRQIVCSILKEFSRLAHVNSVGSHWIDMGDHYADFDNDITQYNFLRYPNWMWSAFNNKLQYQNRLRINDFRELHQEACWEILDEEHRVDQEAFESVDIAEEFLERYCLDDLAVHAAWVVSSLGNKSS